MLSFSIIVMESCHFYDFIIFKEFKLSVGGMKLNKELFSLFNKPQ